MEAMKGKNERFFDGTVTPVTDSVNGRVIAPAGVAEFILVPENARFVRFSANGDFWAKLGKGTKNSGVCTATTTDKLVDSTGAFDTDGTAVGDVILNTTDGTLTTVTAIDSATTLSVDDDIFASAEAFTIFKASTAGIATVLAADVADGSASILNPVIKSFTHELGTSSYITVISDTGKATIVTAEFWS